ncbi:MAG: glycerophosphodiester phosphodiesterase family protein [Elusimicrobiales bacterium]|jgi:glycerophosphoryl diester phosphodiesterase
MKIIAHRGASGYAPENTLSAFELALKMGSKAFEFDLHLTRDGKLVVHHDYDLKRTAGNPAKIAALNYAALKKINVGNQFGFPVERVPLLAEVVDLIGPKAEWINFELKNDKNVYPGLEAELLEFIRARPVLREKALFSSFDYGTLKRLRALDKGIKLGYLGAHLRSLLLLPAILRAKAVGAVNFHLPLRLAFRLNVALIRKAGLKVCVYTVNKKTDALRLQKMGVDGIFSNYPDILQCPKTVTK